MPSPYNSPWHRAIQLGGNAQLLVSPSEAKDLDCTSGAPTLRLPFEGQAPPKHSALKANMTYVHGTHKTMINKRAVLNRRAHACAVLCTCLI